MKKLTVKEMSKIIASGGCGRIGRQIKRALSRGDIDVALALIDVYSEGCPE